MKTVTARRKTPLSGLAPAVFAASCLMQFWINNAALAQETREYAPIVKVAPVYPETALAAELEGYVVVGYTITETGTVADPVVIESSSAVFENAAVESVQKYKYTPRVLEGRPVAVPGVRVRVLFRLPVEH